MARKSGDYYFENLTKSVHFSCAAAELLSTVISNFIIGDIDEKLKEMHTIEHTADIEKHEMMSKLVHEFITPIEREDIIQLSQEIDDITDKIEEILQCIHMYNLKLIRDEAIEFSGLVIQACEALENAMREFHNFKKSTSLKKLIIDINRIEDEGDALYTKVIRTLYTTLSHNAVELISWVKIFDLFESCCDSCEHVANSLERVVLKNS
jgi:predicted phosphate transport protein (TIGR00153 family)